MLKNLQLKLMNRIDPNLIWQLYSRKCQNVIKHSTLILSFDCDTEEDAAAVTDVHSKLMDIGITPVYAVPGAILKKGEKIYQAIKETGAEFINHGGREHTYFDAEKNRHASCFFYDQQDFVDLKEDILLGHRLLSDILGVKAKGWRTPHFGTFQKPEHTKFLYALLQELNYSFSSSTSPMAAYRNGPVYTVNNLVEIPVTGIFTQPFNIMDTWAYFGAPARTSNPQDYVQVCEKLAIFAAQRPVLLNIYGDPSHIHDKPEFFAGIKMLSKVALNSNYSQFIGSINDNQCNI